LPGVVDADRKTPAQKVARNHFEGNVMVPVSGGEPGLGSHAELRRRWQLARGLVTLADANGVRWKVYRCWFPRRGIWFLQGDLGEAAMFIVPAVWLPWFIAKWLGVRWLIEIERNGCHVGDEQARGWRASRRRIHEIAESAATGALQQELAKTRRPTN
jgi:hypothetical protein